MAPGDLPLPTFLVIGAQKSATRWLRMNLGAHPDVFVADHELSFFNGSRSFRRGLDEYRRCFEGWNGEPAVGEATPAYMMWTAKPHVVAKRIDTSLPGVRILAILRDPVQRAYSAFIHHMRRERIPVDADLLTWVAATPPEQEERGVISGGWYARSLRPYVERFGDRLLVLVQDGLAADPGPVYSAALGHIGVDPTFVPPKLTKVRHSNDVPVGSRYRLEDGRRRALTSDEASALYEHYAADVDELEAMFGLDLGAWRR